MEHDSKRSALRQRQLINKDTARLKMNRNSCDVLNPASGRDPDARPAGVEFIGNIGNWNALDV